MSISRNSFEKNVENRFFVLLHNNINARISLVLVLDAFPRIPFFGGKLQSCIHALTIRNFFFTVRLYLRPTCMADSTVAISTVTKSKLVEVLTAPLKLDSLCFLNIFKKRKIESY